MGDKPNTLSVLLTGCSILLNSYSVPHQIPDASHRVLENC